MEDQTTEGGPLITHCPECGKALDVSGLSPYSKIECPHCAAVIRVRTTMGQYEIVGMLGEGGMSQVFRALDRNLGREVALKILHQSLSRDEALTAMFEREAKLTAAIVHPNVVKVYTVGRDHGYLFIAMELLQAISLEQLIANKGALSESEVLSIAIDVARGLQAAYGENLIHRDIKPGNMLVTNDGTTKLVDFGLALQQGGEDLSDDLWATPYYVPPEKLDGLPDTFLGDIYSLGATLYHALAGKPPFEANTSSMEELKEIKKQAVELKSAAPGLSRATIRLVEKMMAYVPGDRFHDYSELITQIEEVRRRQFGIEEAGKGRSRRQRVGLFAGIGGAIVLVLIGVLLAVNGRDPAVEGDLGLGGGERVISAGDQTISALFQAARGQFSEGRFREAEESFSRLVTDGNVPASTRIWSHFFRGTILLFTGEQERARESFGAILGLTPEADAANAEALVFLKRAAAILSDPLPTLSDDAVFSPDSVEAVGLLAVGLKNWQMGQFASGAEFLQQFASAGIPGDLPWISPLKSRVEPFLADWSLLQTLPNPSAAAADLDVQGETLKKAVTSLRTRGAAPKFVKERIERISKIRDLLAKAAEPEPEEDLGLAPQPASGTAMSTVAPLSSAEQAELDRLKTLVASLKSYSDVLLFSAAAVKLQEESFETPLGIAIRDELVRGSDQASRFLPLLAAGLTTNHYEGSIRRRAGRELEATISSATPESFIVDLGFGPNEVEVEEFAPDWLVETGMGVLPPLAAATSGDWEALVYFALFTGQSGLVAAPADELSALDTEFARRWSLVQKLR